MDDVLLDENVDDLNILLSILLKKVFNFEWEFEEWISRFMIREELIEKFSCLGDVGCFRCCFEVEFLELELVLFRIFEDCWWWEGCEYRFNDV